MKYFSLFTGVGGFELGIENAYVDIPRRQGDGEETARQGLEDSGDVVHGGHAKHAGCVGFSEIDKYASRVLRHRFPNVKNYGDITKINWSEVPDFDLLVGGSPCQDLSIAGKRAGLDGRRSGLFYEYARALQEKKPRHFIWENVKGALSSNGGRDFAAVLDTLAESGYALWWQVLNARDFCVPQNRERIFVVGTRDGSAGKIFFKRQNGGVHSEQEPPQSAYLESPLRSQGDKPMIELTKGVSDAQRIYDISGSAKTLKGLGGGQGAKTGLYATPRIRRLTPRECERLMSWPDDWTRYGIDEEGRLVEMSDTQRYKMCGNGVVSKVVEAVIKEHICDQTS